MDFFRSLFGGGGPSIPAQHRQEVSKLIDELLEIGRRDDFLAEHPGGVFDIHCHHTRARAIGRRLNEIAGLPLMQYARQRVRRKLSENMAAHLDYAWNEIGDWIP